MENKKQNTQESQQDQKTSEDLFDRDSKCTDDFKMDFFQSYNDVERNSFQKGRSHTLKVKPVLGTEQFGFTKNQNSSQMIIVEPCEGDESIYLGQNHQSFGNPKLGQYQTPIQLRQSLASFGIKPDQQTLNSTQQSQQQVFLSGNKKLHLGINQGSSSSPDYAASSIENEINVNKFEGTPKNRNLADESTSSISILQKLNANPMNMMQLDENEDGEVSLGAHTPQLSFMQNQNQKVLDQSKLNKEVQKTDYQLPEQNSALPKIYHDGQESLSHGNDSNKSYNSDKKINQVSKINNISMNQIMNNDNSSKRMYMDSFGVMEQNSLIGQQIIHTKTNSLQSLYGSQTAEILETNNKKMKDHLRHLSFKSQKGGIKEYSIEDQEKQDLDFNNSKQQLIIMEIHNDSRAASDYGEDKSEQKRTNTEIQNSIPSNETPKLEVKKISDTPFFAMEKIHNRIKGEKIFLDNKRSSMKLTRLTDDDFTNAIQKIDKKKINQLKNRYSSNLIFSNPENSPNEKRAENGGFSDIEVEQEQLKSHRVEAPGDQQLEQNYYHKDKLKPLFYNSMSKIDRRGDDMEPMSDNQDSFPGNVNQRKMQTQYSGSNLANSLQLFKQNDNHDVKFNLNLQKMQTTEEDKDDYEEEKSLYVKQNLFNDESVENVGRFSFDRKTNWKNREPIEVRFVQEKKGNRDLKKSMSGKYSKSYKIEGLNLIEDAVQNEETIYSFQETPKYGDVSANQNSHNFTDYNNEHNKSNKNIILVTRERINSTEIDQKNKTDKQEIQNGDSGSSSQLRVKTSNQSRLSPGNDTYTQNENQMDRINFSFPKNNQGRNEKTYSSNIRNFNGTPSEHPNYDPDIWMKQIEYNQFPDNISEIIHNKKKIRLQDNEIPGRSECHVGTQSIGNSSLNKFNKTKRIKLVRNIDDGEVSINRRTLKRYQVKKKSSLFHVNLKGSQTPFHNSTQFQLTKMQYSEKKLGQLQQNDQDGLMQSGEDVICSVDMHNAFDGSLQIFKDGSLPAKKRASPTSSSMNFRNARLSVVDKDGRNHSPQRRSSVKKCDITPIDETNEQFKRTLTLTVTKNGMRPRPVYIIDKENSKQTDDEVEIESPLSNNILDIVDDIGSPKMNFRKSLISQFKHRDSVKKAGARDSIQKAGTLGSLPKMKKVKSGLSHSKEKNQYFNSHLNKSGKISGKNSPQHKNMQESKILEKENEDEEKHFSMGDEFADSQVNQINQHESNQHRFGSIQTNQDKKVSSKSGSLTKNNEFNESTQSPMGYSSLNQNSFKKHASILSESPIKVSAYKKLTKEMFRQIYILQQLIDQNEVRELEEDQKIDFRFVKHGFKKLLLFDLDETLIHVKINQGANDDQNNKDGDENFEPEIELPIYDQMSGIYITCAKFSVRPYTLECLQFANRYFEVGVFTAGKEWFANPIIDHIDPNKTLIQHRYFRQHTSQLGGPIDDEDDQDYPVVFVKDLTMFAGPQIDVDSILIIDNSISAFAFNLENGIPIQNYYGDKNDTALKLVCNYLDYIKDFQNLRVENEKVYNLQDLYNTQFDEWIDHYNSNYDFYSSSEDSRDFDDDGVTAHYTNNYSDNKSRKLTNHNLSKKKSQFEDGSEDSHLGPRKSEWSNAVPHIQSPCNQRQADFPLDCNNSQSVGQSSIYNGQQSPNTKENAKGLSIQIEKELYNLSDQKMPKLSQGHATGDYAIQIQLQSLEKIPGTNKNADTQFDKQKLAGIVQSSLEINDSSIQDANQFNTMNQANNDNNKLKTMTNESEVIFDSQKNISFHPEQTKQGSIFLQQKHAQLMGRHGTVKVIKSKEIMNQGSRLLRKDSTQEDLNNRTEDSKIQEDYIDRISEEYNYDHINNDFQIESEHTLVQERISITESEVQPPGEQVVRKEICFDSGSSGGTQCIELQRKRTKAAPTRSITVDEIIVNDPEMKTARNEEGEIIKREEKLTRSHGKTQNKLIKSYGKEEEKKEQLHSKRETQSIFDCVYDPDEDFEVPSVVQSNEESSPMEGKSDIPDSMFQDSQRNSKRIARPKKLVSDLGDDETPPKIGARKEFRPMRISLDDDQELGRQKSAEHVQLIKKNDVSNDVILSPTRQQTVPSKSKKDKRRSASNHKKNKEKNMVNDGSAFFRAESASRQLIQMQSDQRLDRKNNKMGLQLAQINKSSLSTYKITNKSEKIYTQGTLKPPMWGKRKQVIEARKMSPSQRKSSSYQSKKHFNVAKNIDKDLDKLTREMDKYWNDGLTQKVLKQNHVAEKYVIGGFQQKERRRTVTSNTTTHISKLGSQDNTPSVIHKKESSIDKPSDGIPVNAEYASIISPIDDVKLQKQQLSIAKKQTTTNHFNDMIFLRSQISDEKIDKNKDPDMQNIINFYENFKIDNDKNFDLKSLKTEKKMLGKKYHTPIGSVYGSGGNVAESYVGNNSPLQLFKNSRLNDLKKNIRQNFTESKTQYSQSLIEQSQKKNKYFQ